MTEEITILKTIETDFLVAKLRSDNVVHIHIKANTLITVEMQDKMEIIYAELTDTPLPFIFTGDEFVSVTSKARKNSVDMEFRVPVSHTVLVARNLAQRILAEYYYKFNKPIKPLKVAKNFEAGIEWIRSLEEK